MPSDRRLILPAADHAAVLSYGGGRQTVAICVLIARGVLPKPDRIVMADTARERPTTWQYMDQHVRPLLSPLGLEVEVLDPVSPEPSIYSNAGDLIIPVYTSTGKFNGFCSGAWKRDPINKHLSGWPKGEKWIGFSLDERKRVTRALRGDGRAGWRLRFPLVELMMTTADCLSVIESAGLPEPNVSACWMCPNATNAEWRCLRDDHPDLFSKACEMDAQIREQDIEDGRGGVWLHRSKQPLATADLNDNESREQYRQCGLGMCFV